MHNDTIRREIATDVWRGASVIRFGPMFAPLFDELRSIIECQHSRQNIGNVLTVHISASTCLYLFEKVADVNLAEREMPS